MNLGVLEGAFSIALQNLHIKVIFINSLQTECCNSYFSLCKSGDNTKEYIHAANDLLVGDTITDCILRGSRHVEKTRGMSKDEIAKNERMLALIDADINSLMTIVSFSFLY